MQYQSRYGGARRYCISTTLLKAIRASVRDNRYTIYIHISKAVLPTIQAEVLLITSLYKVAYGEQRFSELEDSLPISTQHKYERLVETYSVIHVNN